jgi:hypothetical protein
VRQIAIGLAAAMACAACGGGEPAIPATCNGAEELCERRFDQVVYATTHNAMATEEDGFNPANQYRSLAHQLDDGIRGLMLDTHENDDGEPALCHGSCLFGEMALADGLATIDRFLDRNRGEVVTIIFEAYVDAATTAEVFDQVGLTERVYSHDGGPWPTLREMIDADTRLVVLTDDDAGSPAWYRYVWDVAWETHFAAREISDFSCDDNRGDVTSDLFIFNHFLTRTRPVPEDADEVNANPLLLDRARECQQASGKLPNFVTVDFYSVGDLLAAVDALNQLSR